MPAAKVHAVSAGKLTSSVDGLNFNRVFPGDPTGTITQQIAAFILEDTIASVALVASTA